MDRERIVCVCDEITAGEIIDFIKKNEINSLEFLIEEMPVGDKCESCITDGFDDDGFSLLKIMKLVKSGEV